MTEGLLKRTDVDNKLSNWLGMKNK
jgi:hypothetical protein